MSAKTQHNKAQHNPRIFTLAFLLLASFSLFASAGLNLNVTLTEPANAANSSAGGFTFTFVPTIQNDTGIDATNFSNASIWVANTSALAAGVPGVNWALNQTVNATQALRNATAYSITVSGLSQGNYVWSANVSTNYSGTGGASNFSLTGTNLVSVFNRTFNIDNTAPNSPASVSISSGANVSNGSISYTPSDAVTGVANSTVWVFNNSGNANNASYATNAFSNGTAVQAVFSNLLVNGVKYNYTFQTCDSAGNCANVTPTTNVLYDNATPNYLTVAGPVSNGNVTNGSVTFTPGDAVSGVSNVTVWAFNNSRNAANRSVLFANFVNGSSVTVSINNLLTTGVTYNYTFQLCDSANNCANFTSVTNVTYDNVTPAYFVSTIPANNSNQSAKSLNVSFTPGDDRTGIANTTVWVVNVNGTYLASVTNTTVVNGTLLVTGFASVLPAGTYNVTTQECDYANNCANFSGVFVTVDYTPPALAFGNYTPASGVKLDNQTLFINISVSDARFPTGGNITLSMNGVNLSSQFSNYPYGSVFWNSTQTISFCDVATYVIYVYDSAGNLNATASSTATGPGSCGSGTNSGSGGGSSGGGSVYTPVATATPTPAASATPAPSGTPSATETPAATATPTPAPTVQATPTATPSPRQVAAVQGTIGELRATAAASNPEVRQYLDAAQRLLASGNLARAQAYVKLAQQAAGKTTAVASASATAVAAPARKAAGLDFTTVAFVALLAVGAIALYWNFAGRGKKK